MAIGSERRFRELGLRHWLRLILGHWHQEGTGNYSVQLSQSLPSPLRLSEDSWAMRIPGQCVHMRACVRLHACVCVYLCSCIPGQLTSAWDTVTFMRAGGQTQASKPVIAGVSRTTSYCSVKDHVFPSCPRDTPADVLSLFLQCSL